MEKTVLKALFFGLITIAVAYHSGKAIGSYLKQNENKSIPVEHVS